MQSVPLTLMEPLISEASYWAVLFISPRITVSREPDSAPFSAEIMSWRAQQRHLVVRAAVQSEQHVWRSQTRWTLPSWPSFRKQTQSLSSASRSALWGHQWWSVHPHLVLEWKTSVTHGGHPSTSMYGECFGFAVLVPCSSKMLISRYLTVEYVALSFWVIWKKNLMAVTSYNPPPHHPASY